jgi:hypothetical protein
MRSTTASGLRAMLGRPSTKGLLFLGTLLAVRAWLQRQPPRQERVMPLHAEGDGAAHVDEAASDRQLDAAEEQQAVYDV